MSWLSSSSSGTVEASKSATTSLLFAKTGQPTIRQKETEEVTEYRGLTKDTAQGMVDISDSTTQTTYYKQIGSEVYSITVLSGTKTAVSAARNDESDGWHATKRVVTYSTNPDLTSKTTANGWSTTYPTTGTSEGRQVSFSSSTTPVTYYWGAALYSKKEVTVTEYTGLTQTAAQSLVKSKTSSTIAQKIYQCISYTTQKNQTVWSGSCYAECTTGTNVYASSQKVSDTEGYRVTVTTEVWTADTHNSSESGSTSAGSYTITRTWGAVN